MAATLKDIAKLASVSTYPLMNSFFVNAIRVVMASARKLGN